MPTTPSGQISVAIPNADGSITNLTASLANCAVSITPAPVIVPPPPPPPTTGLVLLPAGVTPTITQLDALTNWQGEHDGATSGTATGGSTYPVAIGGRQARAFPSDYTSHGGFRYHVQYATDTAAKSFIYAGDLYFDGELPAQMELDNNQVTADKKTVIYGVQCNKNDGLWDITFQDTRCHWKGSDAKGDPTQWPIKKWLHFEIMCHRDDIGNVIYDSVHFDGTTQLIATVLPSARALGWAVGHLLVNLQLGGASSTSGSIRCYGNNMQVARW